MMNFISSDSLFFQPFFFSLYTFFPVNMKTALAITRTLSRRYYPLHPEEQEALASIMECRRVDKGELLLEEGRIARHFHYVESGMLRQYYYKNGHDITEHFSCEDDLVFCIISLFRQEPTRLMIEAIEPTVVYDIPYTGLQELFVSYSSIAQLYKKILEWALWYPRTKPTPGDSKPPRNAINVF